MSIRMPPRVCVGPIRYVGHEKLQRDIKNLKTAMASAGADEGFLPSSAPIPAMKNEYYKTDDDFIVAYGDAMREEYKAILDAGLLLQIDFPGLVSGWDTSKTMTLADYRKWAAVQDRAPESCPARSSGGPHSFPYLLRGEFRAADERFAARGCHRPHLHDQGGRLFVRGRRIRGMSMSGVCPEKVKLPDGKILIPGVVTHSNVMIEHPRSRGRAH